MAKTYDDTYLFALAFRCQLALTRLEEFEKRYGCDSAIYREQLVFYDGLCDEYRRLEECVD